MMSRVYTKQAVGIWYLVFCHTCGRCSLSFHVLVKLYSMNKQVPTTIRCEELSYSVCLYNVISYSDLGHSRIRVFRLQQANKIVSKSKHGQIDFQKLTSFRIQFI